MNMLDFFLNISRHGALTVFVRFVDSCEKREKCYEMHIQMQLQHREPSGETKEIFDPVFGICLTEIPPIVLQYGNGVQTKNSGAHGCGGGNGRLSTPAAVRNQIINHLTVIPIRISVLQQKEWGRTSHCVELFGHRTKNFHLLIEYAPRYLNIMSQIDFNSPEIVVESSEVILRS